MKRLIALALLIAASVSGCATAPNQGSFFQETLNGVRQGLREGAHVVAAGNRSSPNYMKSQQTDCHPDYNGGFTCVTREQ